MPTSYIDRLEGALGGSSRQGTTGMISIQKTTINAQPIHTGAGPDNIVQPFMPTGMLQTPNGPAMIHEGETITPNIDGTVNVIPYQPGNQQQLATMDFSPGGAQETLMGMRYGGDKISTGYRGGAGCVKTGYANGGMGIPTEPQDTTMSPMIQPTRIEQPAAQGMQVAAVKKEPTTGLMKAQVKTPDPVGTVSPITTKEYKPVVGGEEGVSVDGMVGTGGITQVQVGDKADKQQVDATKKTGITQPITGLTGGAAVQKTVVPDVKTPIVDPSDIKGGLIGTAQSLKDKYGYDPLQTTVDLAKGESEIYDRIREQAINDLNARNRYLMMFGQQRIAGSPQLTSGAQNLAQAEMMSQAQGAQSEMLASLGQSEAQQMIAANNALLQEQHYQDQLGKQLGDEGYSKAWDRFSQLKEAGYDMATISADPLLSQYMADYLGSGDPNMIAQEFNTMNDTYTGANFSQFGTNASNIIKEAVDTDVPLNEIMNNSKLLNYTAHHLGLGNTFGALTDADKQKVSDWISDKYEFGSKTDADFFVDYAIENLVPDELKGNTQVASDLKSVFQEALSKGMVKQKDDGTFEVVEDNFYPWYDPEKSFGVYTDFDGNFLKTDDQGNALTEDGQIFSTATVTFGNNSYNDEWAKANDKPYALTNKMVSEAWRGVSAADKNKYLGADGEFTQKEFEDFLNKEVYKDFTGTDTLINDKGEVVINDVEWDKYVQDNDTDWNSFLLDIDKAMETPEGELDQEGIVHYYDKLGNIKTMEPEGSKMRKIWAQMSAMYNGGDPLTAEEFGALWGNGKNYRIDDDGYIIKLKNPDLTDDDGNLTTIGSVYDLPEVLNSDSSEGVANIVNGLIDQGKVSEVNLTESPIPKINAWWDGSGAKNRWRITQEATNWVNNNKGKVVTVNGVPYVVTGNTYTKDERKYKEGIQLLNLETGKYEKVTGV